MHEASRLESTAGALLKSRGLHLAVAESCTGGLLGAALTDVPGSSDYFLGGVIAYDDRIKTELLHVPASLIRRSGAVSAESALEMARGVRELTGADLALAVTGIAGPAGGTAEKPVGTTYVGLVGPDAEKVGHYTWAGDRTQNRQETVRAALAMLIGYLSGHDTSGTRAE